MTGKELLQFLLHCTEEQLSLDVALADMDSEESWSLTGFLVVRDEDSCPLSDVYDAGTIVLGYAGG